MIVSVERPSKTNKQDKLNSPHSAAVLLLVTIADTTWRAFVPTIGGTLIGILLDKTFDIAPVYTTLMIIVGFVVSALLITLQIRSVRKK